MHSAPTPQVVQQNMLITTQLHHMTDLAQSVLGALQTEMYDRAEKDARKLAMLLTAMRTIFLVRLED